MLEVRTNRGRAVATVDVEPDPQLSGLTDARHQVRRRDQRLGGDDVREYRRSAEPGTFDDGHRRAKRGGYHSGFITARTSAKDCDAGRAESRVCCHKNFYSRVYGANFNGFTVRSYGRLRIGKFQPVTQMTGTRASTSAGARPQELPSVVLLGHAEGDTVAERHREFIGTVPGNKNPRRRSPVAPSRTADTAAFSWFSRLSRSVTLTVIDRSCSVRVSIFMSFWVFARTRGHLSQMERERTAPYFRAL